MHRAELDVVWKHALSERGERFKHLTGTLSIIRHMLTLAQHRSLSDTTPSKHLKARGLLLVTPITP
jgi:hypothetical protein